MKFLSALAALFLATSAVAQTTVIPYTATGVVSEIFLVVPSRAHNITLNVEMGYSEFNGYENTAPFKQYLVTQTVVHFGYQIAMHAEDFLPNTQTWPAIYASQDVARLTQMVLQPFDGFLDFDGVSGSGSQAKNAVNLVFNGPTVTFPTQFLPTNRLYIRMFATPTYGFLPGYVTQMYASVARATVVATYD
jgi:hypothetical protein